jgi:hypothetical protein
LKRASALVCRAGKFLRQAQPNQDRRQHGQAFALACDQIDAPRAAVAPQRIAQERIESLAEQRIAFQPQRDGIAQLGL